MKQVVAFIKDDDGLTVAEYAAAAGLITVAVTATFTALGVTVNGLITTIASNM